MKLIYSALFSLLLSSITYGNPLSLPLIQQANFQYTGAFLLDAGPHGVNSLHDAEGSIAFRPARQSAPNGSLFVSGNLGKSIAEFAIPEIEKSEELGDLAETKIPIQKFVPILDRAFNAAGDLDMVGSLLYTDESLIVSAHRYYPASNERLHGLSIIRNPSDLQGSNVDGYFKISEKSALDDSQRGLSGWMSPIPEEWRALLGGTHLFGPADGWNISGRNAEGPAVFAFNPLDDIVNDDTIASGDIVASTPLMDFNSNFQLEAISQAGEGLVSPPSELWSSMSFIHFGFIPKGSRTLVFLGEHFGANNDIGYKITTDSGRTCGGPCPFLDDDYYNYYWMFDLKEVLAAKNGEVPVHSVKPYSFGRFNAPFQVGPDGNDDVKPIRGGSYDHKSGRLFLTLKNADFRPTYTRPSVYAVYQVDSQKQFPVPRSPENLLANGNNKVFEGGDLTVTWNPVTKDMNGNPIDIAYYRISIDRFPHEYSSSERFRAYGATIPADKNSFTVTLSSGNWAIKVRAFSTERVPSNYATIGEDSTSSKPSPPSGLSIY